MESFIWIIVLFDEAFKYGNSAKFLGYVETNAKPVCAEFRNSTDRLTDWLTVIKIIIVSRAGTYIGCAYKMLTPTLKWDAGCEQTPSAKDCLHTVILSNKRGSFLWCRRVDESGVLSQVYATKNVIVLFQDHVITVGNSASFESFVVT
jgi:hypothetical protein